MNHIEKAKELALPYDQFVLVGGSVLDIHGLRSSDDIDVIVSQEAFKTLRERGWEVDTVFLEKWGRERLVHDVFEVYQNHILQALDYLIPFEAVRDMAKQIEGVYVIPLGFLLVAKLDNGNAREKDLSDIELIKKHLHIQDTENKKLKTKN